MAKSLKLIVEALLFAADKPLAVKDLRGCLPDTKPAEIKSALKVLKYEYEAMGRSFSLHEIADGYQLRSRSEYGPYILRLLQSSPERLSRAAMETLAIIAYKQPILRQEIERLRGVDVGGIVRTLLERGLIKIMGRKNLPGRPLIYGTTGKFLEVFDLKNIESLPNIKEMQTLISDEYEPTPTGEEEKTDETSDQQVIEGEPVHEFPENGPEYTPEASGQQIAEGEPVQESPENGSPDEPPDTGSEYIPETSGQQVAEGEPVHESPGNDSPESGAENTRTDQ